MLDLGSSLNVMPSSMYFSLNFGVLKQTGIVIQLADGSNAYPKGVLRDVLVQVNGLIFPTDFMCWTWIEDAHPRNYHCF